MMMEEKFVTIVSGLPRSGTSMMMKALEAGGMPVLIDGIRKPDRDNPKGYYEFEPVKKTREDPSWLQEAGGKAVKMVYRLLYDLPEGYRYRVVFTQRDMGEILKSQKAMLDRTGQQGTNVGDDQLAALFKKDLEEIFQWIERQSHFSKLLVSYNEMVRDPRPQCLRVNDFLGHCLDVDQMVGIVDASLYRNRG